MIFTVSNTGASNSISHINDPYRDDRLLCGRDATFYLFAEEDIYFEDGELYREDFIYPIHDIGYCKKCLRIARKLDNLNK